MAQRSRGSVYAGIRLAVLVMSIRAHIEPMEEAMFSWVILLFVIAIIAGILGFSGIAASAATAAQVVFVVALLLAIIGFFAGRPRS